MGAGDRLTRIETEFAELNRATENPKISRRAWTEMAARCAEDVPDLVRALRAVLDRCKDFDANGNSRELGDPTAATWHEAASIIRRAIEEALR